MKMQGGKERRASLFGKYANGEIVSKLLYTLFTNCLVTKQAERLNLTKKSVTIDDRFVISCINTADCEEI